jgi:hypothetical protein
MTYPYSRTRASKIFPAVPVKVTGDKIIDFNNSMWEKTLKYKRH